MAVGKFFATISSPGCRRFLACRQTKFIRDLATADSLLREANRIAADPHSTAADLMGAALVLSDMQPNYYMSRTLPDPASVGYLMWAAKLPAIDVHWREGYRNMLLPRPRVSPRGHKSGARLRRLVAVERTG